MAAEESAEALEQAAAALETAVARKEKIQATANMYRTWFSRGLAVWFVLVLATAFYIFKSWDTDLFTSTLKARVSAGGGQVVRAGRRAVEELLPVYRKAFDTSLPEFSKKFASNLEVEASHLRTVFIPLMEGSGQGFTDDADKLLADLILTRFKDAVDGDKNKAMALAKALRTQQTMAGKTTLATELDTPYSELFQIQMALRGIEPPGKEPLSWNSFYPILGTTLMDVVRNKVASGEGLGIEDESDTKAAKGAKSSAKGGK